MRESTTAYVILGLLATGGPMTGYEVRARVGRDFGHFWSESYGQLYPELKRLSAAGLAVPDGARGEAQAGKPYRITAEGRRALAAWLEQAPAAERLRSELSLKLSLGRFLGADALRAFVAAAARRAEERLEDLREREEAVIEGPLGTEDRVFALLALERSLATAEAELDWSRRALAVVTTLEEEGPDGALRALVG